MSGTVSTLSSTTKGDPPVSSAKQPTKTGFDHLDVNKLFKGKTAEPTTKLVAQKHGMQTLGKVLPARRAGGPVLSLTTGEPTSDHAEERKGPGDPSTTFQDPNGQGWTTQQQQQYPAHTPLAITNQIPIPPLLEKKWSGGRADGNYPSRFAQEFPTLDAAVGEGAKVPSSTGPPSGHRSQTKSQDNQYGPGPILRPPTEGSWTQGGGGGRRPSPPTQQPNFPPERGQMGGPVPSQMAIGQIPPPLGAYHPTFRPNQPNMYQKPGSGGGFYPGGPPNPSLRFGMPIPHDAPPPGHSADSVPPPMRRAGGPAPRPSSHFTSKPIIKQEEMERMDEIGTHDGGWASTNDDVDYNKRICFSDEEDQHHQSYPKRSPPPPTLSAVVQPRERQGGQDVKVPPQIHSDSGNRRMDEEERPVRQYRDAEEDWRPTRLVDKDMDRRQTPGDRDRGSGRNRGRDDDWRSGPRTSFDDFRGKKVVPPPQQQQQQQQRDTRPDFHKPIDNKFPTNVPPRFRQQQQNQNQPPQRQTPSPNTTTANGNGGKETAPPPPYKILERKRGESESSRDSNQNQSKDKRKFMNDQIETRQQERDGKGEEFHRKAPPPLVAGKKEEGEKRLTTSSSWAEEMDEDESLNAISEIRKSHHKEASPVMKREERRDRIESKRIIKQTKVADMTTITKQESPPAKSNQNQGHVKEGKGQTQEQQLTASHIHSREVEVKGKPNSAWAEVEKNEGKEHLSREEDKSQAPLTSSHGPVKAKGIVETKHPRPVERENSKEAQPPMTNKHHVPSTEHVTSDRKEKEVGHGVTVGKEEKKDHHEERRNADSSGDQFYKRGGSKPAPPRKNSRESKHPNPPTKVQESVGDESKRPQQKSHENLNQHKEQRAPPGGGDGKKEEKRGPAPPKHNQHQQKQQLEPKTQQPGTKLEEGKGKNAADEGRRQEKGQGQGGQGFVWSEKRKVTARLSKEDEETNDVTTSTGKESKGGEGHRKLEVETTDHRRQNKSPSAGKRNERNPPMSHQGGGRGGASRLQGYGPPSDRSPFSSNTNKEPDDERKDKERKDGGPHPSTRLVIPLPTSGPVPLMALGEISPPDMPLRNRHHEFGQHGRPPRFQRDRGFQQVPPQRGGHKQVTPNVRGSGKGGKKGPEGGDGETQPNSGNWNKAGKEELVKVELQGKEPNLAASPAPPPIPAPEPVISNKVPTMVFENTKMKLTDTTQGQQQPQQPPGKTHQGMTDERSSYSPGIVGLGNGQQQQQDKGGQQLDMSKPVPLPFPKESSPTVKLDFGGSFGSDHGNSRSYSHPHDPHGHINYRGHGNSMSPLQGDLPDNLQAIRSIWETPSLPSDHSSSSGQPANESGLTSNSFGPESGFGSGKESESPLGYTNPHALDLQRSENEKPEGVPYHLVSIQRNSHQSLSSGGTNGYSAPSVIAKPVSSGSPGLRQQQMKNLQQQQQQQQQQHSLDTQQQGHGPISFSPFGYGMPQGANAFGPIGGVPSPPSIYAQKSTPLYQPFNHHDNTHVLGGGGGRSHSGYGSYAGIGTGVGGGNPYASSLYLQGFENYGPYGTHSGPPPQSSSLQLQNNNRISPGLPPTSGVSGLSLSNTAPGNPAFKAVRNLNPNSISHPSLHHQNNQQPFSQLTHHMAPHPHLTPIGPQKQSPYSQQPLQPPSQQLYMAFDPNQQSLMSLGGNYGGLRSGGGPPPSATPPMPGLSSSSYYAPNPGVNQGYPPQQNPQAGNLQGIPVPPPGSNPHYGIQYQPPNLQQFNSQGPTGNVLGNSLVRPQHGNRK